MLVKKTTIHMVSRLLPEAVPDIRCLALPFSAVEPHLVLIMPYLGSNGCKPSC